MIPIKRIKPATIGVLVVFTLTIMLAILITTMVRSRTPELEELPYVSSEQPPNSGEVVKEQLADGKVKIVLDNFSASRLVAKKLSDNAPVKDVLISFYEPNGMIVDGTVLTRELSEYLNEEMSQAMKTAVGLLPAECDFSADLSVFTDGEGGVTVELVSVYIGSLAISPGLLPENFQTGISLALSEGIREQGLSIERIKISDGSLEAEGELIEKEA